MLCVSFYSYLTMITMWTGMPSTTSSIPRVTCFPSRRYCVKPLPELSQLTTSVTRGRTTPTRRRLVRLVVMRRGRFLHYHDSTTSLAMLVYSFHWWTP